MSSQFVHLHFHTHYSLLDGAIKVKGLGKKLKELGYGASAITDHGNMHGAIEFHHEMKANGIKPIIGMEAYVAKIHRNHRNYSQPGPNAYHAVLLCENKLGYQNLCKLASHGFGEGKYYGKPRIDHELLEQYNEGLIVLSACLQGELANRLRKGEKEEAYQVAQWYKDLFPGRYYVELQANGIPDQDLVNPQLIQLARDLDLPLIGTNDCHYMTRDMAEAHYILQLMGWQKKVTDAGVKPLGCSELYVKSPEEMHQAFAGLPAECLANSLAIAERCELDLECKTYYLPDYPTQAGRSLADELTLQAKEGLDKRLDHLQILYHWDEEEKAKKGVEYHERLDFELKVINQMGFPGYFLIVADFINWSKDNGVPVGPGRGSGAGSLVAYAIRITDIDPIEYDLLFERFLNPERVSMPDFDVDFEVEGRERVIEYTRKKYGEKNVCQISAIGSLLAKGALRGVARVLDIPYTEADKIAKLIPDELGITLKQAMDKEPKLKEMAEQGSDLEQKLIRLSLQLEGLNNNLSTHAAGVIIMNSDITDVMPTCTPTKGEGIQSMYTMKYAEDQGAVKFDFLGLRNLTVIDRAVAIINQSRPEGQEPLDISLIPMDDPASYKLLQKGDTTGVFQLESGGMKALIQKLAPTNFEEIIALVALYRPGPLGSGMVDTFVECKHGRQKPSYMHPLMEEVLKETYGVIVYQEQVMRIVQVLADYSLGGADLLRRAMGKKIPEIMEKQRAVFVEGCGKKDIPEKLASDIFDLITEFAKYGFNKSHSAAYALISYQTAYLKANYPVEFMAALLTADMNKPESVVKLIAECKEMGIQVLPPDINQSELHFTVVEGKIRFGLNAIKNVGATALQSILDARRQVGRFEDLLEMFTRMDGSKVNSRVLEALIKAGVFDSLEPNRRRLFEGLDQLVALADAERRMHKADHVSMFDLLDEEESNKSKPKLELPDLPDWKSKFRLKFEKEALGFYISGHPLDPYLEEIKRLVNLGSSEAIKDEESKIKHREQVYLAGVVASKVVRLTKTNKQMAVLQLEDPWGSIEVVVFPELYGKVETHLNMDDPVLVIGQVNRSNGLAVSATHLLPLQMVRAQLAEKMFLQLPSQTDSSQLERMARLLHQHPGPCKVGAVVRTANQCKVYLRLPQTVQVSDYLLGELEELIPGAKLAFYFDKQGWNRLLNPPKEEETEEEELDPQLAG